MHPPAPPPGGGPWGPPFLGGPPGAPHHRPLGGPFWGVPRGGLGGSPGGVWGGPRGGSQGGPRGVWGGPQGGLGGVLGGVTLVDLGVPVGPYCAPTARHNGAISSTDRLRRGLTTLCGGSRWSSIAGEPAVFRGIWPWWGQIYPARQSHKGITGTQGALPAEAGDLRPFVSAPLSRHLESVRGGRLPHRSAPCSGGSGRRATPPPLVCDPSAGQK